MLTRVAAPLRQNARCMGTGHLALHQSPDGLPASPAPGQTGDGPDLKVSTLESGLRVASANWEGHTASVGVFVGVGSRNETKGTNGTCHLMEHLAFRDTEGRSYPQLVRDLETCGGNLAAGSSREVQSYSATVLKSNVQEALGFLGDTIVRPHFRDYIIAEDKGALRTTLEMAQSDPVGTLSNALHRAAFSPTATLGLSGSCPLRNLGKISVDDIEAIRSAHFVPSNMVLVGVGMDESALMPLARELGSLGSATAPATAAAKYVGGSATVEGDIDLAHVAVAFGSGGASAADASAMSVLEHLLGGSVAPLGGLGGTATSRLNVNVDAKNDWVHSVSAFNAAYSDAGLVGAHGTVSIENSTRFVDAVVAELEAIAAGGVSAEEASRASAKAQAAFALSCETKSGLMEAAGAQLSAGLSMTSVGGRLAELNAVGAGELQAAAKTLLATTPSIAVVG